MRFYCRDTQHGTPGRVSKCGARNYSSDTTAIWSADRGRRKDSCTMPDDLLTGGGRDSGARSSWGERGRMPSCDRCHWGIVVARMITISDGIGFNVMIVSRVRSLGYAY